MNEPRETNFYNIGLQLLRALMCFEVVLYYFWTLNAVPFYLRPFDELRVLAVPVFMLMSFYLMEPSFCSKNKRVWKKRLERIAIPLVGWAVIYYAVYKAIYRFIHLGNNVTVQDMFWQLFTGHSPVLNESMWYQSVLFILTVTFLLVICNMRARKTMLCSAVAFSLILQYSVLNVKLFGGLRYELKYPLGRLVEMTPFAAIGFFIAHRKFMKRLENYRMTTIVCASIIACLGWIYLRKFTPSGFTYSGIYCVVLAICIFVIAYVAPLNRLPEKLIAIINFTTRYTLGIYCMHRLVATCLKWMLEVHKFVIDSFVLCIFVYLISFMLGWLMSNAHTKLLKQLVS